MNVRATVSNRGIRVARGRALAAAFVGVLACTAFVAPSAWATNSDACGQITEARIAKAFGLSDAIKHNLVVSAPENPEGVISDRCRVFVWRGTKPLNDKQRREAVLEGRMAILTIQTWVPDQGPNGHLWRDRFEEFLKQQRAASGALFLKSLHGVRLTVPKFGAEDSVGWRADVHRTRRVRALWWSRSHKSLISMNVVEAAGKPVVRSLEKVAEVVVPGVL